MFEPKDKSFDKDSLQTPPYIFNWLNAHYDFDVDLAASDKHHFVDSYFSIENSAFDKDWHLYGNTGFCNPPYSKIDPWVYKAIDEAKAGFTTVMLIPDSNGEERFGPIFENATGIIHLIGRVSFIRPDNGEEYKQNNRGSCVIEFAPRFMREFPISKFHINTKWIKSNYSVLSPTEGEFVAWPK